MLEVGVKCVTTRTRNKVSGLREDFHPGTGQVAEMSSIEKVDGSDALTYQDLTRTSRTGASPSRF